MKTHSNNTSKTIGFGLAFVFIFPLYIFLVWKEKPLSTKAKIFLTFYVILSPSLWVLGAVITLIMHINEQNTRETEHQEKYTQVSQTCSPQEMVEVGDAYTFTCKPYEDVVAYSDKIGAADEEFLSFWFDAVERKQISFKWVNGRNQYSYIIEDTALRKTLDVHQFASNTTFDHDALQEKLSNEDLIQFSLPLSSEHWSTILEVFYSHDSKDNLGFVLRNKSLIPSKKSKGTFQKDRYEYTFDWFSGDSSWYAFEENTQWSVGKSSPISIAQGKVYLGFEKGYSDIEYVQGATLIIFDEKHKRWFLRTL